MRKLNYLFLTLLMVVSSTGLFAQDTINHLIISELRWDGWNYFYIEYTNMHATDSVDLTNFYFQNFRDGNATFVQDGDEVRLTEGWDVTNGNGQNLGAGPVKKLGPGESFVWMNVVDHWNGQGKKRPNPIQSPDIVAEADLFNHIADWGRGDKRFATLPYLPELQCWGFDSLSPDWSKAFARTPEGVGLIWASGDTIAVMVDQALVDIDWSISRMPNAYSLPPPQVTAGIVGAHDDFTLVRKFSIKEGETNWALAGGSDAESSSWMLIPHWDRIGRMAPRTVGNHGAFTQDVSSSSYVFDETAMTVTVPWGTEKFDSITAGMTLGDGMSWWYLQNDSEEDSLSRICKDNDTLVLYACGNTLDIKKYAVIVTPPTNGENSVFGKNQKQYQDPDAEGYDPDVDPFIGEPERAVYWVDEYADVMDTVGFVPFATPVDTFFRLLEKAPNAEWEIVWKSGKVSSEVAEGDILKVTAENGSVKEYYIQVEDFVGSDDLQIASITWPDRPSFQMPGWGADGFSDTIPGFQPAGSFYEVSLPPGTMTIPALVVVPRHENATVTVDRATSLRGGVEERSSTFHIMSETDTSFGTVTVIFDVVNPDPQKFVGDPIFSKFYFRDWWTAGGMEITNPTDVVVDLSQYMVVRVQSDVTKAAGVEQLWTNDSTTWLQRYLRFVAGYKWGDFTQWSTDPGYLYQDGVVNKFVQPKDQFILWKLHPNWTEHQTKISFFVDDPNHPVDVFLNNNFDKAPERGFDNPWGEPLNNSQTVAYPIHVNNTNANQGAYYLLKIENDSVLLGTKKADDPDDYSVVDVMGSTVTPWNFDGAVEGSGDWTRGECYLLRRKANIYFGDTVMGQRNSITNADSSQWWADQTYGSNARAPIYDRSNNHKLLGNHPLDPITGHLSVIYSVVYNVSRGYSDSETLAGASKGESVADLLSNVIKADETQMLSVTNSGGTDKGMSDAVADGDILVVTAATGNVTKYTISTAPIGGDPGLTAVDTSVTVTEAAPYAVGGFDLGTTLAFVLSKVETKDLTAVINIINTDGALVPTKIRNSQAEFVDVIASANIILEVVAEDGSTRNYALKPNSEASDAFLISEAYVVTESPALVSNVPQGTGVEIALGNVTPSEGATVRVLSITGQERTIGNLGFGDRFEVVSQDGSTTNLYQIQFEGFALAFVTSTAYTVDQGTFMIEAKATDVATFLSNLTPSEGSSMMLKDENGDEKTTGDVAATDMVYVVSGDKTSEALYTITLWPVSNESLSDEPINVYPNPATDVLYLENIPEGTYVRVSDITGRTAILRKAAEISRGIELNELSNGVYLLSIEKDGDKIHTTRFIKK